MALDDLIREAAISATRPDKTPYRSLTTAATRRIADRLGLSGREVEIAALTADIIPERYSRNLMSFSPKDQIRLLTASVVVVGLGGLGGTVTEILARMGVGKLLLIDGDRFEDSNLNRQLLSGIEALGTPKAAAAARRVTEINPSVEVSAKEAFLDKENFGDLISGADLVIDCLDNLTARFALDRGARALGVPLVTAAVAGTTGQLTVILPEDPGLEIIYGDPANAPEKGVETRLGTLPFAVTTMASLECAEAAKILLGRSGILRNRLLIVDLAQNIFETVDLTPE